MNTINSLIAAIAVNRKYHFLIFFAVLLLLSAYMTGVFGPVYEHPGYDYYFHLKRFEALITALREGTFPHYIDYAAALNYGYLSKIFYSDVVLIPFAALGILIGSYNAFEVMLFTMTIFCGIFMYSTVKTTYKSSFVAFLAGILYTFSVYRFYDIYNRGAMGEVFAFTFIPLVFLGLYHIIKGDYRKWYVITIGFSLLIFSHVISTVLTFITVVIVLLFYYKQLIKGPKRFAYLILAGIVTLAITAVYIFPLLEQMQANTYRYETNDWTLPANAKIPLDYVFWGLISGFYYPDDITIVGIGILLTAVVPLRFFVRGKPEMLRSADIGLFIGLFYIFASSKLFPWGRFPFTLLSFIQYPGRLYLLVTFFFAIAAGYYLSRIFIKEKGRFIVALAVILCTAAVIYMHNDNFRIMHIHHIGQTNEKPDASNFFYLNGAEYVPDKAESAWHILLRGDSIVSMNGNTTIESHNRDRHIMNIRINTQSADSLELPLFYYKGYTALLNNKELPITQSAHGLVQMPVDQPGRIEVWYDGTIIQRLGFYISVVSIIALSVFIFLFLRKDSKQKK